MGVEMSWPLASSTVPASRMFRFSVRARSAPSVSVLPDARVTDLVTFPDEAVVAVAALRRSSRWTTTPEPRFVARLSM